MYTQDGCPKCKILKKKLQDKNIQFSECSDVNVMMSKGVDFTPMLEIDGKMMDYATAVKWANEV